MAKISSLKLENFTCFRKLELAFSEGVNVLIGVNGTGKTHILKVLYAACAVTVGEGKGKFFSDKLRTVFAPYEGRLERLCRHALANNAESHLAIFRGNGDALKVSFFSKLTPMDPVKVKATTGPQGLAGLPAHLRPIDPVMVEATTGPQGLAGLPAHLRPMNPVKVEEMGWPTWSGNAMESVYIPVKEMLAHAPGFISLTARREIAFEDVYVDILKQAYLPKLKELPNKAYENIHEALGEAIGGKVVVIGEHFFLKTKLGEIEFSLFAEGLRKLALLWLLIQNGSLNPGSILFWDEPDANLNPSLLGLVVETILQLQRQGVQVFVTTHNYVLLKEFDLRANNQHAVQYVSLFRDESDAVIAYATEDYLTISPNAISGTLSDLYKRDLSRALQE